MDPPLHEDICVNETFVCLGIYLSDYDLMPFNNLDTSSTFLNYMTDLILLIIPLNRNKILNIFK